MNPHTTGSRHRVCMASASGWRIKWFHMNLVSMCLNRRHIAMRSCANTLRNRFTQDAFLHEQSQDPIYQKGNSTGNRSYPHLDPHHMEASVSSCTSIPRGGQSSQDIWIKININEEQIYIETNRNRSPKVMKIRMKNL